MDAGFAVDVGYCADELGEDALDFIDCHGSVAD